LSSGPASVGADAGTIGFWTAPDLAVLPTSVAVAWWDGDVAPGNPATYQLAYASRTLDVSPPEALGASDDAGSPVAVESTPDGGFLLAWSTATADGTGTIVVERFDALGEPRGTKLFGEGEGLVNRPALAVDRSGAWAIGWRVQDESSQTGLGVSLAIHDSEDHQIGHVLTPGLTQETANRIDLSAHDGMLAACWEEAGVDGDVLLQVFALDDGSPLTGAFRVHDDPTWEQVRPNVALRPGPEIALGVAWESTPSFGAESSVRVRVFQIAR
jgi:hypothetical protein